MLYYQSKYRYHQLLLLTNPLRSVPDCPPLLAYVLFLVSSLLRLDCPTGGLHARRFRNHILYFPYATESVSCSRYSSLVHSLP